MTAARTDRDDQYLSTLIPVQEVFGPTHKNYYITKITTLHDEKVHHIIVDGCTNEIQEQTDAKNTYDIPCAGKSIIYAWALNADPLVLPKNAAIRVGGHSKLNSIKIECHYKDQFDGVDNLTGIEVEFTEMAPKSLVGIFLLGANYMALKPHVYTNVNCGCQHKKDPIDVFALRTHAHNNGRVITGYRYRSGEFDMIGKGNPLWPHAFYTRVGGPIRLEPGDYITATCRYFNDNDETIGVGASRINEMCNLYLMYSVPFKDEPLEYLQCWGYRDVGPSQSKIPDEVNEVCPYPGYAGLISDKAIESGSWKKPLIPEIMVHHHAGPDDQNHDMHHDMHHDEPQESLKDHLGIITAHEDQQNPNHDENDEEDDADEQSDHEDQHDPPVIDLKMSMPDETTDVIDSISEVGEEPDYIVDDIDLEEAAATFDINEIIEDQLSRKLVNVSAAEWQADLRLGEVAGVDTDSNGNVWIFHRGDRTWADDTFDDDNNIISRVPTTANCVVCVCGETGKVIQSWGKDLFYMPHGITVDGNIIWLTDVGTHQIYKFHQNGTMIKEMGVKLTPGLGDYQFCKPTDVLIDDATGEFFVSDGYCNSRVIRYSADFTFLDSFGSEGDNRMEFNTVHDLSKGPGGQIFISDRDNGRIQVYDRSTNSILGKYEDKQIGPNIYSSVYSPEMATLFLGKNCYSSYMISYYINSYYNQFILHKFIMYYYIMYMYNT